MQFLNHSELQDLFFFRVDEIEFAGSKSRPLDGTAQFPAFGDRMAPHRRLTALLQSAPTMYQALSDQFKLIQDLIEIFEPLVKNSKPVAEMVERFQRMQDLILFAQSYAQLGADELAKSITAVSDRNDKF